MREVAPAGADPSLIRRQPSISGARIIDVEGAGDRAIRTIEFTYDAQSLGGKKARVRVYGKN